MLPNYARENLKNMKITLWHFGEEITHRDDLGPGIHGYCAREHEDMIWCRYMEQRKAEANGEN